MRWSERATVESARVTWAAIQLTYQKFALRSPRFMAVPAGWLEATGTWGSM